MPDGAVKEGIRPAVPEQNNKGPEQPQAPGLVDRARNAGKRLFNQIRGERNIPKVMGDVAKGKLNEPPTAATSPATKPDNKPSEPAQPARPTGEAAMPPADPTTESLPEQQEAPTPEVTQPQETEPQPAQAAPEEVIIPDIDDSNVHKTQDDVVDAVLLDDNGDPIPQAAEPAPEAAGNGSAESPKPMGEMTHEEKMAAIRKNVADQLAANEITQEQAEEFMTELDINPDMIDDMYDIIQAEQASKAHGEGEGDTDYSFDLSLEEFNAELERELRELGEGADNPDLDDDTRALKKKRNGFLRALMAALKAGLITVAAAAALAAVTPIGAANMARQQQ